MSVVDEEELTDAQKRAAKDLSHKTIKPSSDNDTDTSLTKQSGR